MQEYKEIIVDFNKSKSFSTVSAARILYGPLTELETSFEMINGKFHSIIWFWARKARTIIAQSEGQLMVWNKSIMHRLKTYRMIDIQAITIAERHNLEYHLVG